VLLLEKLLLVLQVIHPLVDFFTQIELPELSLALRALVDYVSTSL
jgi:hypothetical protein